MKNVLLTILLAGHLCSSSQAQTFPIVDTGQMGCYNDQGPIKPGTDFCPEPGRPFFGQDAQQAGRAPSYRFLPPDKPDAARTERLVYDNHTGLTWMSGVATDSADPKTPQRFSFREAQAFVMALNDRRFGGFGDWRLPTVKELYSLILFTGSSMTAPPAPYIDTAFFEYSAPPPDRRRPGPGGREEFRPIDVQFWSSTLYAGQILQGHSAAFGVNFADGRIKAYPTDQPGRTGQLAAHFLRCVRGPAYGINRFTDNGDGTISDLATGLMWTKFDIHAGEISGTNAAAVDWETALRVAEELDYAGHQDWRLPDVKELQSIVDYTRAPTAADPERRAPAINPVFSMADPFGWYWTGTTHLEDRLGEGTFAAVICFGPATGLGPAGERIDVHGAGAQRSSPKSRRVARPDWLSHGLGPQHDEVRITNYVRCVRNFSN